MATTNAQKNASRKWDSENMKSMTCRVRMDVFKEFSRYAHEDDKTAHELLKNFVERYVSFRRENPEISMGFSEVTAPVDLVVADELAEIADEKGVRMGFLINAILSEWVDNYDKAHPERQAE